MGRVKKYVKKQAKRLGQYAKKRYAPAGKLDIGRIAKDVAMVKSVLNVERKFYEVAATTANIAPNNFNWNIAPINTVPQGDGISTRDGHSLRMKSIHIKGQLELNALTAPNRAVRARMMLIMDREVNSYNIAQPPSATEFFVSNNYDAFKNWNAGSAKRFTVLASKKFWLTSDRPVGSIDLFKKCHIPVKFTTTDTTGTAIIQNPVYIVFQCDAAVADVPQATWSSRITYVDN